MMADMTVKSGDAAEREAKIDVEREELAQPEQPDVVPSDKAGDA